MKFPAVIVDKNSSEFVMFMYAPRLSLGWDLVPNVNRATFFHNEAELNAALDYVRKEYDGGFNFVVGHAVITVEIQ